jgi:hypothetical protein
MPKQAKNQPIPLKTLEFDISAGSRVGHGTKIISLA